LPHFKKEPEDLGSPTQLGIPVSGSLLRVFISFVRFAIRFSSLTRREGLLEVMDYIVNMLVADGNTNEVFGDSTVPPFLLRKLLVCRGPRMDGQRFGVTDTVRGNGRYQYGRDQSVAGGMRTLRGSR